jgi:hypothetical protein
VEKSGPDAREQASILAARRLAKKNKEENGKKGRKERK